MSRPDPSSPRSVAGADFSTVRRGFDADEVRSFLVAVAAELERLRERERQLEGELRREREQVGRRPERLDEETVARLLGDETVRVIRAARESAAEIVRHAEETAARLVHEANDEVHRLRVETDVDVARRRQDAVADAEAEVSLAKEQGREMVNEARAYRERVLADLEQRTALARAQIEELLGGRDRLLQVFERARVVAVDVVSVLQGVDAPSELVNLAPVTGPVPVMVPAHRPAPAPRPQPVEVPVEAVVDTVVDDGVAVPDEEISDPIGDGGDESSDTEVVDGIVDVEPLDDVADDDDDDDDDGPDEPEPIANVVSLFRGRDPQTDHDAIDTATDIDDTGVEIDDTVDAADHEPPSGDRLHVDQPAAARPVDTAAGIFARLRDELPSGSQVVVPEHPVHGRAAETSVSEPVAARRVPASTEGVDGSAFSRRDEVLVPLIVSAGRKVKRVMADEQNAVLDRLRRREAVTSIDDLVPDLDTHLSSYSGAVQAELTDAAVAGVAEVGGADGSDLRASFDRVGAIDAAIDVLCSSLIAPLRHRIEAAVNESRGDNESITRSIRLVYREWKSQQIDTHLDDLLRSAYGGGVAAAVEPGTPLLWSVDPSVKACPDCEDNSLSAPVPAGTPFPTGHLRAPAHPGCRCLALPVR